MKLKSALRSLRAVFLSQASLSAMEYSQLRLRSRSSPVSRASALSPIASICFRFRSSLAAFLAELRVRLVSVMRSLRFRVADSV